MSIPDLFKPSKIYDTICESIFSAFDSNINVTYNKNADKQITMQNIQMFIEQINNSPNDLLSQQIKDKVFDRFYSFSLTVGNHTISINILCKKSDKKYVSYLLHAINTFCHAFQNNYDGLRIDIVLDKNKRDLIIKPGLDIDEIFALNKKFSTAFNVSGVTIRSKKLIILTKKQEMIKLLFHELVHYVGLDNKFVGEKLFVNWKISNPELNISEAYTEYLSIIIHSIYISIHLKMNKIDITNIINKEIMHGYYLMSVYLKFYGYDKSNINDFFTGTNKINNVAASPIATFEYVFLRCLFFHHDLLSSIPNIIVKKSDVKIINKMTVDKKFIENINKFFTTDDFNKLNYICNDLFN